MFRVNPTETNVFMYGFDCCAPASGFDFRPEQHVIRKLLFRIWDSGCHVYVDLFVNALTIQEKCLVSTY